MFNTLFNNPNAACQPNAKSAPNNSCYLKNVKVEVGKDDVCDTGNLQGIVDNVPGIKYVTPKS